MAGPFEKLFAGYLKANKKNNENDLTARFLADPEMIDNGELLKLLLSYTSDAKRADKLMREWTDKGLDFYDIFRMNYKELRNILNVREDTAALILLVQNAVHDSVPEAENTLSDCIDKLRADMKNTRQSMLCEEVWIAGLDEVQTVRLFERVSIGDGSHAKFEVGDLVRRYSMYSIHTVVLMHTHPGVDGAALSEQDRRATEQFMKFLGDYRITLGYHIVIADDEYKAFACRTEPDGVIVYDYVPDIKKITAVKTP